MTKKRIGLLASTFVMVIAILLIGPLDVFTHGYYCDVVDYDQIVIFEEEISLEDGYEMEFSPIKEHFAGFEINLAKQIENNEGMLNLSIYDSAGKELENIQTELSEITENEWYCLYSDISLKKGTVYTLRISTEGCSAIPSLHVVDDEYLTGEDINKTGVLIGYAYAESTFSPQNKVLISLLLIAIWGFACALFVQEERKSRYMKYTAGFVLLTTILAWNFMYNSMDKQNTSFDNFQKDSEKLVSSTIMAEHQGVWFEPGTPEYGLGRYSDEAGVSSESFRLNLITEGDWQNGYSMSSPLIAIRGSNYLENIVVAGNSIEFPNGDIFLINAVWGTRPFYIISLNATVPLSESKYGSLSEITFYDSSGVAFSKGSLVTYISQYGLQGKIFRHIARFMDYEEAILNLNLLCAILTATVFVAIVYLLAKKYNIIMAACFFITFWLSPWIVNFARNLYWVEFTWFIPMAIGILCAWKVNNRKYRIFCYMAMYLSIAAKCLCGYEYISTIMMSGIAFLLTDFVKSIAEKDFKQGKLLFRTIFVIGVAALLGFATAICMHALLRGDGSIVEGIKSIIEKDVLRRTNGGSLNEFVEAYWPSLNASVWEVLCKYMHFSTEIIAGVAGNVFPLLCVAPCFVFAYEVKEKKLNIELLAMYIVFFLSTISWFCLAKSHSYIHDQMNYVLWYTGFVQICFYIIINKIAGRVSENRKL